MTAANIRRHRTRFLFLQNTDDLLIAKPAAFDWSVSLRNRLYRNLATFQGGTSKATAERAITLTEEQTQALERFSPELPKRHIEAPQTEAMVGADTFFVGTLKGVGEIYLQTAMVPLPIRLGQGLPIQATGHYGSPDE